MLDIMPNSRFTDIDAAYDEWENSRRNGESPARTKREPLPERISIADLIASNPHQSLPLIDGLLRLGETANIIAPAKVGKSWLSYSLALSIATGTDWLKCFSCRRGRVLIIDNELHPATLAHRIPAVADALGHRLDDYRNQLDVIPLRGRLMTLSTIGATIVDGIAHGEYAAVIIDAWYRVLPGGSGGENDNAAVAQAYNFVDLFAKQTGAAWLLVHHSTKGSQAEKRVTDVGAGAGAQSRAADTHLILREHEEDGCVTMDAAVRSFPPVAAVPLRWTFPVWSVDTSLDPKALKRPTSRADAQQNTRDQQGRDAILRALKAGPVTKRKLREKTGFGSDRLTRLLSQLRDDISEKVIDGQSHIIAN